MKNQIILQKNKSKADKKYMNQIDKENRDYQENL
jgi:hypothetical protein